MGTSSDFFKLENNRSIFQQFLDIRPLSPLSVESVPESPAGIAEDNSVTTANCDNSHASTPASFLDNLGVDSTSENPAGTPENNNVTAANCDNPRASTPTSTLDNSNSSGALSQLLANHTPQVTAAKRPTAGTPENNNVTAANFDNPHASTPTSSLGT